MSYTLTISCLWKSVKTVIDTKTIKRIMALIFLKIFFLTLKSLFRFAAIINAITLFVLIYFLIAIKITLIYKTIIFFIALTLQYGRVKIQITNVFV